MSDSMRAVVIARYGGSLQATRRPVPRPGPGEVLVRCAPAACAAPICTCSLAASRWATCRAIVGHELAGDVVELGAGVSDWRLGDRVTAAIDVTCGRCRHCLTGATQRCRSMKRIGFERDGGHADYVAVPASNLVALGAEISYEAAAILPDAVACMYHSLIHQGGVGIGQRVLILGVGGLGIHGVQIARSAGAEVLATSRQPQRVALAEQYGAVGINTAARVARGGGGPVHRRRGRGRRRGQHRQPRERPPGAGGAEAGRKVPGRGLPRRDLRGSCRCRSSRPSSSSSVAAAAPSRT